MAYSLEQYQDIVNTGLRYLMRDTWSDVVTDLQRHVAMPEVFKKERVDFNSGWGYQFNVRVGTNSPAQNVQLNQPDNVTTSDMHVLGTGNFRITQTYWYINEVEIDANREPARLVNLLKSKKVDAMTSLADKLEANFWGKPADSNDVINPRGIQYWLVRNTTQGFNGGVPSGFTDVAGISPTTYPRWSNYTDQYVNITKADLVRRLRRAMTFTDFRPPVPYPSSTGQSYSNERGPRNANSWGLYTNYSVVSKLEEMLESQDDDLGNDVAPRDGVVMVRRAPLIWAPYLESDTQNTFYGINWKTWKIYFMEGNYMRETEVRPFPFVHRGMAQFTDCVYDFACIDRRQNFRISL